MSFDFSKESQLTGNRSTMHIHTDESKFVEWLNMDPRPFIQTHFPELSADEREFIMTGSTPEEWDNAFGEEEVEDEQ